MNHYNLIEEKYNNVISGSENSMNFYSLLWPRWLYFVPEEKKQALVWSEQISENKELETALHQLTLTVRSVFGSDFSDGILRGGPLVEIFTSFNDPGCIMTTATLLGMSYRSIGQLDKAQEFIQLALSHSEKLSPSNPHEYYQRVTFYQAAELCAHFKNNEKAIEYYSKGLNFVSDNPDFSARFLAGLGTIYMNECKWEQSLQYLEKAKEAIVGTENFMLVAKVLSDLGVFYYKQNNFEKALQYHEEGLKIRIENNLVGAVITSYIQLAEIWLEQNKTEEATRYGTMALEQAEKLNVQIKLFESHLVLSKIYERSGNIEKAFEHYKKYTQCKEKVHSEESIRKMEQLNSSHKIESMQQEKEIFRLRNVELKSAMEEITESFRYAKRIQKAILPSDKTVSECFPESFVLYKPKDIVAGDFYWMEETNGTKFIAVCDCTGHGVPGAMVSVVCHNALNRAVREFKLSDPGKILDKARQLIIAEFEKSEEDVKDGMDVVLCGIREEVIYFSGANNPLWLIANGMVTEIKGSKQPVGKHVNNFPFENHIEYIQKDTCIYLFTDGYADQFGGEKGKKFRYKQLQELLLSVHKLPMKEQHEILEKRFNEWKGSLEQVDDVCIIGIKL
ncbi:MAG: tetratricopeptide repeat protein [Bacteroidia bacterium]|nr:tetratricopeptide repeat protein [Bacteroidia bacterium]